jgi:hypothetical protein
VEVSDFSDKEDNHQWVLVYERLGSLAILFRGSVMGALYSLSQWLVNNRNKNDISVEKQINKTQNNFLNPLSITHFEIENEKEMETINQARIRLETWALQAIGL